jgi:hypothetical protein
MATELGESEVQRARWRRAREPMHLLSSADDGFATGAYPPGFEENDHLRSDFIRQVTLRQLGRDRASSRGERADRMVLIPRTLVRFWHEPYDVPPDVRRCLESWDVLRDEGFAFRMFGDASAAAYIAERYGPRERAAFARCRHPAMRSDYLRLCFVLAEGGLYVDADDVLLGGGWRDVFRDGTLEVQPLCYDVTAGCMVSGSELRRADLPPQQVVKFIPIYNPELWLRACSWPQRPCGSSHCVTGVTTKYHLAVVRAVIKTGMIVHT